MGYIHPHTQKNVDFCTTQRRQKRTCLRLENVQGEVWFSLDTQSTPRNILDFFNFLAFNFSIFCAFNFGLFSVLV